MIYTHVIKASAKEAQSPSKMQKSRKGYRKSGDIV